MNADGSKCVARWSISYRVVLFFFGRRLRGVLFPFCCCDAVPPFPGGVRALLPLARPIYHRCWWLPSSLISWPSGDCVFLISSFTRNILTENAANALSSAVVADALCLISKNKKTARAVRYSISISQGNMNEPGHGRPVSLSALYAAGPLPGTAGRGLHHFFGCCAQMLRGRKRYRECPMRCWCALDLALS